MVPIRVLVLFAIPLIGVFLQKSSSKSMDESNSDVERAPELGEYELTRSKRDVDSAFAESKRAVGESEPTDEDKIKRRGIRFGRRFGRRRSGRRGSRRGSRRRVSRIGSGALGTVDAIGTGLDAVNAGMNIADMMNNGENDDNGEY